jgi:hypothetical protein
MGRDDAEGARAGWAGYVDEFTVDVKESRC